MGTMPGAKLLRRQNLIWLLAVMVGASVIIIFVVVRRPGFGTAEDGPDAIERRAARLQIVEEHVRIGMSESEVISLLGVPDGYGAIDYLTPMPGDPGYEPVPVNTLRATNTHTLEYDDISIVINGLGEVSKVEVWPLQP